MRTNARTTRRAVAAAFCVLALGLPASAPAKPDSFAGFPGRILVSSGKRDAFGLVAWRPDGVRSLVLVPEPYGGQIFGDYAPDGTKIALWSTAGGNAEIYVMNADGTGVRRLTHHSAVDANPSWSPDGRKIAFTSNRDGDFDIYVMDADGSNPVNLTSWWSATDEDQPHWSPRGDVIAFGSFYYNNWDVFVMTADGKSPRALIREAGNDWFQDWSPDGAQYVVRHSRGDSKLLLYAFDDPLGLLPHARLLVLDDAAAETDATWSPSSDEIAYSSNRDGDFEVYVVRTDGSGERQITHNDVDDIVNDWQSAHDIRLPTARALASSGRKGSLVRLRYSASDDSGRGSEEVLVYRGRRLVGYVYSQQGERRPGTVYSVRWRSSKRLSGALRFCVTAYDPSSNESAQSCAPLRLT